MNRRAVLLASGTGFLAFLSGCLGESSPQSDVDRLELPEWPDDPSASAVTTYATRYSEVRGHNQRLDQLEAENGSYDELSYSCSGAFEAETSEGYVVTTSCYVSETVTEESADDTYSSEGPVGPQTLLATDDAVIRTSLDHDWRDFAAAADPPFTTRGITLVNFSSEHQQIDLSIDDESADEDDSSTTVFADEYDLEPETGETDLEVIDRPGKYDVTAIRAPDHTTTLNWHVSEEPREPITIEADSTLDIALGIYVLPDQTLAIHEIPEDRATE